MKSSELLSIEELSKKVDRLIELVEKNLCKPQEENNWLKTRDFLSQYNMGRTRLNRLVKEGSVEEKDYGGGYKFYRFVGGLTVNNCAE